MNLLLTQVENASDPYLKKELKKECQKIQRELDQTFKEAEELKQSIFTKIFSFLYTLLAGKSKRYVSEILRVIHRLMSPDVGPSEVNGARKDSLDPSNAF